MDCFNIFQKFGRRKYCRRFTSLINSETANPSNELLCYKMRKSQILIVHDEFFFAFCMLATFNVKLSLRVFAPIVEITGKNLLLFAVQRAQENNHK